MQSTSGSGLYCGWLMMQSEIVDTQHIIYTVCIFVWCILYITGSMYIEGLVVIS